MRQGPLKAFLPTIAEIMQICASPCHFTGWIHFHTIQLLIYEAEQGSLWQHQPTTYTSALGNMFWPFYRFARQLIHSLGRQILPKKCGYSHSSNTLSSSPRLCFL